MSDDPTSDYLDQFTVEYVPEAELDAANARAEAAEAALREVAKRLDDVYDALASYRYVDPEDRLAPPPR